MELKDNLGVRVGCLYDSVTLCPKSVHCLLSWATLLQSSSLPSCFLDVPLVAVTPPQSPQPSFLTNFVEANPEIHFCAYAIPGRRSSSILSTYHPHFFRLFTNFPIRDFCIIAPSDHTSLSGQLSSLLQLMDPRTGAVLLL